MAGRSTKPPARMPTASNGSSSGGGRRLRGGTGRPLGPTAAVVGGTLPVAATPDGAGATAEPDGADASGFTTAASSGVPAVFGAARVPPLADAGLRVPAVPATPGRAGPPPDRYRRRSGAARPPAPSAPKQSRRRVQQAALRRTAARQGGRWKDAARAISFRPTLRRAFG